MTLFDQFVLSLYNYYKHRFKRKASAIAVFYISFLQSSLILLLGVFFAAFFNQMKVETTSSSKAWTLFVIVAIFIYFKNWMQFNGKIRAILNAKRAKSKSKEYNIWVLWFFPIGCIILSIVLLDSV